MATAAILIFSNSLNFIGWRGPEGRVASSCLISSKSVNPLWRYYDFSIFQDGGRLLSWICLFHIWTTHVEYLGVSITLQNLVMIDAVVVLIIWTFQYLAQLAGKRNINENQSCSKSVRSQFFVNRVINVWNNLSQDTDFSSFNLFKCAIENMDLSQYLKYDK